MRICDAASKHTTYSGGEDRIHTATQRPYISLLILQQHGVDASNARSCNGYLILYAAMSRHIPQLFDVCITRLDGTKRYVEPGEEPVSYTHLRAHETREDLVCRLLLEKKKKKKI